MPLLSYDFENFVISTAGVAEKITVCLIAQMMLDINFLTLSFIATNRIDYKMFRRKICS